jgi:hypothetical protein
VRCFRLAIQNWHDRHFTRCMGCYCSCSISPVLGL